MGASVRPDGGASGRPGRGASGPSGRGPSGRPGLGTSALLALAAILLAALAVTGRETSAQDDILGTRVKREFQARYGRRALERLESWQRLIRDSRALPAGERLARVNDFFNRIRWVSDDAHWGQRDYWASPLEMLGTGGGDCEDYSIAKFVSLLWLGIDEERLRITYVRATTLNQTHMVLAYYPPDDPVPLILDNLEEDILPASRRGDLLPVYSFNGRGLWSSVQRGRGRFVGQSRRLEPWRRVEDRMRADGLMDFSASAVELPDLDR